ncbi:hypothetical protein [Candidatus Lokiarchaeum ossiferum]|uniref:hypothetical protein n=1 Tax=Candidatus Lokiarchaeum ossiferum TaxID=2951803 RepID=UPI00352C0EE2
MAKTKKEKIEYAKKLIEEELSYDEIQKKLFKKFGSGMSNSTIKRLSEQKESIADLKKRNKELENELNLFKRLYFDLLERTEKEKKSRH